MLRMLSPAALLGVIIGVILMIAFAALALDKDLKDKELSRSIVAGGAFLFAVWELFELVDHAAKLHLINNYKSFQVVEAVVHTFIICRIAVYLHHIGHGLHQWRSVAKGIMLILLLSGGLTLFLVRA